MKEGFTIKLNYLYKMNSKAVKELQGKCSLAFLPMGPTEVHGPHLPLFTDIASGLEIAERAAAKLAGQGIESVIATPITYCHADITNCFPGNTSLRPETVTALVEDICVSLARSGFNNIVITSGHADPVNAAATVKGCENAKAKNPCVNAVLSAWFDRGITGGEASEAFSCEHPQWDIHAGESETSFIMMRYPELIDMDQVRALKPNWEGKFLFERIADGAEDFIECGAPDAYFGDPACATAENGDRQYDIFSDIAVEEAKKLLGRE